VETQPSSQAEISAEQRTTALRAYVKARDAALDNRHLQAVTEYLKAHAIDPTSPEVLRGMARSYDALGNSARALELLERLVQIDPQDSEAIFAIGVAAGARRDFPKAIGYLGVFKAREAASGLDPAVELMADFTLAMSLRELGYDRAFIEIGERVAGFQLPLQSAAAVNAGRLASVYRQRGETWRAIGDAHCRLGDLHKALEAYGAAAALPTTDPSALHPRIIYAQVALGLRYNAQRTLLQALRRAASTDVAAEGLDVHDRDVRLCGYLAENAAPVEPLARAVLDLHQAHPEDGSLVRAASLLLPADRAVPLLRAFSDRRPKDLQAVAQLLEWVSRDDLDAAAALTIALSSDHPDLAYAYSNCLAQASSNMTLVLQAVARQPASPARALVESLLTFRAGSIGRSWTVCQAALEQWPTDAALRLRAVEIAAAMREPALVNQTIEAAQDIADVRGLITLSQARRAMNQTLAALQLAQHASSLEPGNVDVLIEVARAHHARGLALANEGGTVADIRAQIDAAISMADQAIEIDPKRDDGYEVLHAIYGPSGVLADHDRDRDAMTRLGQANPQSPLFARVASEEARDRGQFDAALERALTAYEGDPADVRSLAIAVDVWGRIGRLEDAERWLREQLVRRPGDAALREQLVVVQVRRNHGERAIRDLEATIAADPDDWIARRLLETVYRSAGELDSALVLGEERLRERPLGVRRDVELAALYAGAERAEPALDALESVLQQAGDATLEDLASAIGIAGRIQGHQTRAQATTLALVNTTIERFPDAPLQVYGSAMRALAAQNPDGEPDERFDDLVRKAVAKARGAGESGLQGARLWHDLCQALVGEGAPAAAARAMRIRMDTATGFETTLLAALVRMTVVLDAAASYDAEHERNNPQAAERHARATMALLEDVSGREVSLQRVFDTPKPIDLATAIYEASVLYNIVGCEIGAETLLREAISANPDHAMALNNLGYMLLERNSPASRAPEVAEMIERSHALEPLEHNILDTVGWLRYKQGRFADVPGPDGQDSPGARALIQRAIDTAPEPGAEVYDHLGDVCWRMGDEQAALDAWGQVIRLLEDGSLRQSLVQNLATLQSRQWQMIVMDGERMYDREYAPVLERARAKIEALRQGDRPPVAPVWQE
jgi:tetratricopeptide (TPR) repeat protein